MRILEQIRSEKVTDEIICANAIGMSIFREVAGRTSDIEEISRLLTGVNHLVLHCQTREENEKLGTPINFMDPAVRKILYLIDQL